MSEVKRYGHISYLVEATPQMVQLYPSMTIYTLASDFDALDKDNTRLTKVADDALDRADAQRLRADTAEAELVSANADKEAYAQNAIDLRKRAEAAEQRIAELEALLNTLHTADWFEGVKLEAGHQIQRWGSDHDAGKGPADWFWLIGYLAQKAMTSQIMGNEEKAKHHTISTGAALLNWFRAITGDSNAMRPGIDAAALNPNPEAESHE